MRKMYVDTDKVSKDWESFKTQSIQNDKRVKWKNVKEQSKSDSDCR